MVRTVVIDAGHGGHDMGCSGKSGVKEKDVALAISLKLGQLIESNFPDVKVVYTRKTDVFLELHERAQIANNAHADLFICVHCNSACFYDKKKRKETCKPETEGAETFIMGLHKTEANLEVSRRENSVVVLEKDYKTQYDGFDPNSPEADIIFSLYQGTYMEQSLQFASAVQDELTEKGRVNRGVKQAGFWVLYKTAMPSVLIETGFLSSPVEEKFLGSAKGQQSVANCIYRAFRKYKTGEKLPVEEAVEEPQEIEPEVKQPAESEQKKDPVPAVSNVWLSVQIISSPDRLPEGSSRYKGLRGIWEETASVGYRYHYGKWYSMDTAIEAQSKARNAGFKDAFVVAFR
ncbi:MAG: N-acetylmuramoyl-L-alanine amidase, partial [Bacteroidota bacterium]